MIGPVPLSLLVFVVAAIIGLVMVFTSKYETPPAYYKYYSSYVGFIVGVVWIYVICNEVVSVIRVILRVGERKDIFANCRSC